MELFNKYDLDNSKLPLWLEYQEKTRIANKEILDVLWCQPIKLILVVSTSEFHEY